MKPLAFAVLALCLVGCEQSLEDQQAALDRHVARGQFGGSPDVFLRKLNMLGQWEPVALVFGFEDDLTFCAEVADAYMRRYPQSEYTCTMEN